MVLSAGDEKNKLDHTIGGVTCSNAFSHTQADFFFLLGIDSGWYQASDKEVQRVLCHVNS